MTKSKYIRVVRIVEINYDRAGVLLCHCWSPSRTQ